MVLIPQSLVYVIVILHINEYNRWLYRFRHSTDIPVSLSKVVALNSCSPNVAKQLDKEQKPALRAPA